jgi:hypothetical protein
VGAAGFEPAFDREERAQLLDDRNARDGPLAVGPGPGPPPPVAAVRDQDRFDPGHGGPAADEGHVPPVDRVLAELPGQVRRRRPGPGEDDQAGGVAVQPVHGDHGLVGHAEGGRKVVGEGLRQVRLPPGAELGRLVRVPHRRQPRRLVHDHDRVVGVNDLE